MVFGAIKKGLFGGGGGFGADNPEFRNFAEYTGALERLGILAEENPEALQQYFSSPAGRSEMQRLGFNSPQEMMSAASSFAPNVATSQQFADLAGGLGGLAGQTQSSYQDILASLGGLGGDLTDYGSDFTFTQRDIENIPEEVYADMQEMQEEQAARGFRGALEALGQGMGSRGFRGGAKAQGLQGAEGSSLGRSYLEQLRNISRDIGMQKAQSELDLGKFLSGQDLARQQLQSQTNMQRAQYLSDLQKYAKNFGLNKGQLMGQLTGQMGQMGSQLAGQQASLLGQQSQAALTPYTLGQNYYGMTAQNKGPEAKKGMFGSIARAGATIGGAALGGPVGDAIGDFGYDLS